MQGATEAPLSILFQAWKYTNDYAPGMHICDWEAANLPLDQAPGLGPGSLSGEAPVLGSANPEELECSPPFVSKLGANPAATESGNCIAEKWLNAMLAWLRIGASKEA